ncbi:hypothetical protein F0562_011827 [Nyssa sinensis]|uniref:Disease resistance protein At4g27190-like leucine-rich repeats domain-containing protein n=1 Tax=Nyssa sinensis TaxID=561372 RepID=A0A5J4ZU35_9ASTE|nr:hypothetical protein F0562_011827 [Nyssa sinensis]
MTSEGNSTCTATQPLFNYKIAFPVLEYLVISGLEIIKEIWDSQLLGENPFSQLHFLEVSDCHNFVNIVPSHMLPRLRNLVQIHVDSCDSVISIGLNAEEGFVASMPILPQLKELSCQSLRNVFSLSVAINIVHLEELEVSNCEKMQEIIATRSGSKETLDKIEFPRLKLMRLESLQSLKSFWSSESQEEERVEVVDLAPFEQQSLFNDKVAFPSLEELYIKGMDELNNKWHAALPTESFCKLRVLVLESCGKLLSVGPLNLLQRLENLQELEISKCGSLEEVFKVEEEETSMKIHDHTKREEETTLVFHQLSIMRFKCLPYLRSFYSGSCILEFPSLKELWIECCGKLETIIPTINAPTQHFFNKKVTFPSLEKLYIKGMDELNNKWHTVLPTESFSKLRVLVLESCGKLLSVGPLNLLQRLENLQELEISKCGSLEEVFKVEEEETSMKIHDHTKREETTLVFHQLKIMRFKYLLYLRSFYSGSCILEFPSLEELRIECCGKLETIFPTINAPTQHFFNKKVVLPGLKKLYLISLFNLREIGIGSLPLHFIQILEVRDCGNLRNLFSSSIATTLERLEELKIESCEVMEEIVASEGLEEVINQIVFPQLRDLRLSNLPNLTRFCNANYALNLPSLESARLERCMKMQAFAFGQGRDWQWKKKQKMMHDNMQLRQLSR